MIFSTLAFFIGRIDDVDDWLIAGMFETMIWMVFSLPIIAIVKN